MAEFEYPTGLEFLSVVGNKGNVGMSIAHRQSVGVENAGKGGIYSIYSSEALQNHA